MSRLVSLLIVLLAIAVATPVLAEQRLSLSGQMRVRGIHQDNQFSYNKDASEQSSQNRYDQRLRVAGRISVAEGVSVHFRSDLSPQRNWGTAVSDVTQADNNDRRVVEFQHAFLNVDKGMFNIRAGRMNYSIGNAIAVDTQGDMLLLTLKGDIPVEIGYAKLVEGTPLAHDNDLDLYTVAVKHGTDMYDAVVFGGFWRDARGTADVGKYYGIGTQMNMKLDPVNVNFEINYFTGDNGASSPDKVKSRGLQAFADVSAAVADNITVGSNLFYAKGYSKKNGTNQVTNATDDGSWRPETYSFMTTQFNIFGGGQPAGVSTLSTFDPTRRGKGVYAIQPYVHAKVMDDLSVRASVGYWRPQESNTTADEVAGRAFKHFVTATVGARYNLAARTNLDATVGYTMPKADHRDTNDDNALFAGWNLNVNF